MGRSRDEMANGLPLTVINLPKKFNRQAITEKAILVEFSMKIVGRSILTLVVLTKRVTL